MALSRKLALLVFCIMVFAVSLHVSMKKNSPWQYYLTLSWDSQGYYLYLPAVVLNNGFDSLDLRGEMKDGDVGQYAFRAYPGTHKLLIKYSYGVALMEYPFFITSKAIYMSAHDKEPNIYGEPYMKSIIYADAFYLSLGLFILGLFLLQHFRLPIVILSELIIWIGTSLLYYSSYSVGYSHVCSFFLIACLVYLTPLIYEKRKTYHIALASFIVALIVLIRLTDAVIVLYPLLYNAYSWQDLKERLVTLLRNWYQGLWLVVFTVVVWYPQMMYWHYLSGNWFLYSYGEEGFDYWYRPKMLQVLLHPQNGFFLYAPLMLLGMVGLFMCLRKKIFSAWAILTIFLITDYICGSWWYWNFGAAYGFRPYIDFLPLLIIPLAYFLTSALTWRRPAQLALGICIIFFLFLSWRLQEIYTYPWQGWGWGIKDVIRVHKEALYIR